MTAPSGMLSARVLKIFSLTIGWFLVAVAVSLAADDARLPRIDNAIRRGLSIVEKAAKNYPSHRQCFSCHHQTLPLLAMHQARAAGFEIDQAVVSDVEAFTFKSFSSRLDALRQGRRIGGGANTVSYGLWTLALADRQGDETTTAMVDFLLKNQHKDGRFVPPSNRPPLEQSPVAATVLSSYYLRQFAATDQAEDVSRSLAKARDWLSSAALASQEDYNFRLWSMTLLADENDSSSDEQVAALRKEILSAQHDDGGWSQLPKMNSDAYATGQTLFVLQPSDDPSVAEAIEAGIDFLITTQHDDGSWLVETRSKPVQVYFDNGDPHGKSQFISIAATSWAIAALARSRLE